MSGPAPEPILRWITPDDAARLARPAVDRETLAGAARIVEDVRARGVDGVRDLAERFGERGPDEPLMLGRSEMADAVERLEPADREALERAAGRIRDFAGAQRDAIGAIEIAIPGGRAGHTIEPVSSAGCYAPAGRYPLPSSVLMTVVTARVAGCERVVVATPGAHPVAMAAAGLAGADSLLAAGGAHAIAALAYGIEGLGACDVVVGPGNRWVTAAKQIVSSTCGIDMLAGPSELLILADESADPALVAADLLAQAEHDADASAMLVTTSEPLVGAVRGELGVQLEGLATRETARAALANGFVCVVGSEREAIDLADRIAPEHLEIMTRDAERTAGLVRNAGAVFIGSGSGEVLGDYGAGPNHTLPTGGTARFQAGLSVMHFLRLRTWMRIDEPVASSELVEDTIRLARMEGLAAHAEAARGRLV